MPRKLFTYDDAERLLTTTDPTGVTTRTEYDPLSGRTLATIEGHGVQAAS